MTENRYRLPRTVVPHRYDITIEPDLATASFSGSETIEVTVEGTTEEIVLNAIELELDHVTVDGPNGESFSAQVNFDEGTERVYLALSEPATPGTWTVTIRFRGILNDQLRGFYRSVFSDGDGQERVIATTQFEATDARRAFPCWDEPDLKAVFAVTLVVPAGDFAVSNTREVERVPVEGGKVAVRFADTMKMSTYLVAFVVGPLEATEPVDVDGIPLRVVHTPGKAHLTDYALDAGAYFLRWFAAYYGIPYPGDKMDFIAIPDFAFGAMENLGAVTFREDAVLIDPEHARQQELARVTSVIAHEVAHMWFGDLVTMKWWNGVWLNEAFATFMEKMASDSFHPQWKTWLEFAPARGAALDTDGLAATRPVEFTVEAPDEADQMFDSLTYLKGSSLLRMLQQFLGDEAFRQGVEDYLRAHSYGNTDTDDLWAALEGASGRPVGEIMTSWILQGGFPAVEIAHNPEQDGLTVEQRPFTYLPGEADTRWHVPLLVRFDDGHTSSVVVGEEPAEIIAGRPVEWAVANAGGQGFYRVRYTPELLDGLLEHLPDLDALERYTLLDDTWAFVKAGRVDAATYLDLAARFEDETEAAVWALLTGTLSRLHRIVEPAMHPAYESLVRDLLGPAVARLGWEPAGDEDDLTRKLRGNLLEAIGTTGGQGHAQERARRIVDRAFETPDTVDPDVAVAAAYITAANGTEKDFTRFYERYRAAATPQEETRFLYTLADFPDPKLAEQTFQMTLDGRIRTQNGPMIVGRLLANEKTGAMVWPLIERNWDRLVELFPPMIIKRVFEPIWARHDLAAEIRDFLSTHQVPHSEKAIAQALERLDVAERLARREANRLTDYLQRR